MRTLSAGVMLAAVCLGSTVDLAIAEEDARRQLALELARVAVDDSSRQAMEDRISIGMIQAIAATLQERLSRRLLDAEWRMLGGIVRRFVGETLGDTRTRELTAEVYMQHFDEAELRELVRFQRSALGEKARQAAPLIARETAEVIEREIETSLATSDVLDELRDFFPILGAPESP